ncbi:SGNH/GDSL hydrolase family protein [Blastococcus sp. TF02A-26]|uniref:SGNH/GDSL hydrolase family protein n=1 Tax=Blastococcus sp. TF02A-26 TaxID=2250577 RepID=UPI000DE87827|nr:SGNH/GDSL hydrolase family protein [Blastococcus sp. TF02A-26]RBY85098.1 SGNH/GDSL hydrolase family protein [Blastococcus sp. TF02A-26]
MRRSRGRRARASLLAVLTAGTLAACAADDSADDSAEDAAPAAEARGTYLALGDSIPFGFVDDHPGGYADPDAFVGYPELIGEARGLEVVNTTCPGESTASFGDVTADNYGCTNVAGQEPGFRDAYPLHVDYDGSQLDEALRVLRGTEDVELVTLQIGANDAFLCDRSGACDTPEGREALGRQVEPGVAAILAALRTEGGYDGPIVVLGYYSLDYGDPVPLPGSEPLNRALAAAAEASGAAFADVDALFRPLAEAAGGTAERAGLVHPDDVHPTPEGQRLLADAVEQVLGPA